MHKAQDLQKLQALDGEQAKQYVLELLGQLRFQKNKIDALQQLKEWMGHTSIQTTQIYLHFIESDVASPLDD